jgi:hypothetical protein
MYELLGIMFPPRSPADTSLEFEPNLVPSHPRRCSAAQPMNFFLLEAPRMDGH